MFCCLSLTKSEAKATKHEDIIQFNSIFIFSERSKLSGQTYTSGKKKETKG